MSGRKAYLKGRNCLIRHTKEEAQKERDRLFCTIAFVLLGDNGVNEFAHRVDYTCAIFFEWPFEGMALTAGFIKAKGSLVFCSVKRGLHSF